ncbi:hypothetical protein FOA52_012250 [Chlamydomonas sp. UWO 241]|nr:hypothetical protein FOA52_012250 [Chlamydomonas sp. UWO 241]
MLGRLLRGVAEEAEVPAVGYACGAFCCVLSAHYLLLPMREEAGLALGVDTLPVLFTTSLAVTLMAAPACAGVLARARRGEGHVRLFTGLAGILIFLYAALCLTPPLLPSPPDASAATQLPPAY